MKHSDDPRERLWAYEDFTAAEEHPGFDVTGAFASLGFLRAAIRRTTRAWALTGAAGLLLGGALFIEFPPAYTATASVMLTNSPDQDPLAAITTDQTLAASHTVADGVVRSLRLPESVSAFSSAYTVTIVTSQVLQINVSAPSRADAVARAGAVATQFLKFRATMLRSQQAMQAQVLNQMVTSSRQQSDTLSARLDQLKSQGASSSQISSAQAKADNAASDLQQTQQTVQGEIASAAVSTAAQINGSQVLDPATGLPHSRLKFLLYYLVTGLFGGLVLGIVVVLIRELMSDRLRRRDDVADALGTPVKLSVGPVSPRALAGPRARAASRRDLARVSGYLAQTLTAPGTRPSALTVVAVGNARAIAPAVVSAVQSCAGSGRRVILADLVPGAPVARLLDIREPGTQQAGDLTVFVPAPHDPMPAGPLRSSGRAPGPGAPDEALMAASRAADVILTVADLDPALGAEHLPTWAPSAVAVVTAGKSHAVRVDATGEMLRLSGVRLQSAILTSADRGDESLGVPQATPGPEARRDAAPLASPSLNGTHTVPGGGRP